MFSYKEQIRKYLAEHKSEVVETLKELARIPSMRGEPQEGAPYGKDCARVLEFVKSLYDSNGIKTELDTQDGYLLAYYGEGKKTLGMYAHADVVVPGDGWSLTTAFEPIEMNGCLVGRGVMDNKSAVIVSLYCVKMLKELNIPFNSNLVLFTGSNEETGMADMKAYAKKHTIPDFAFVNDTKFPFQRGDKGTINYEITSNDKFDFITDIKAGNMKNATLATITVKVKNDDAIYDYLKDKGTDRITITRTDNEIVIDAVGISKHAALPEDSVNAGYLAFGLLADCPALSEKDRNNMKFIADLQLNYYGESLGIEYDDVDFGKLTIINDVVNFADGKITLGMNIRLGGFETYEGLKKQINSETEKANWSIVYTREVADHITPLSDPGLKTCLDVYEKYTGDVGYIPDSNPGGTYGRYLPSCVEIGTEFKRPNRIVLPEGHGYVHQPDEYIGIDELIEGIELTMYMLLACDKNL